MLIPILEIELPREFFTLNSMLTLTGAAGATYVVCNGLQRAFNFNPKWLALVIALSISLYGVYSTSPGRVSDYFVGIINGFLIFCTAAGATELGASKETATSSRNINNHSNTPQATKTSVVTPKRRFNHSWF